jgi:uncharacterized membrane protein YkvA (DUF1232 family)
MANPAKSAGLISEIMTNARLAYKLFRDTRVSKVTKLAIPGLVAAYLLLPIDLLPDLVPVLGQLDDLAIIALALKFFVDLSPKWLVDFYRDELAGKANPTADPRAARTEKTVDGDYRVID